jgi:hypothetical protein
MMKISYHDEIKVKLSNTGKAIFKMHYGHEPRIDEDGFYEAQLWELMHTFGPYIKTNPNIFEDRCLYMDEGTEEKLSLSNVGITHEAAVLISAYTGFLLTKNFLDVQEFCEKLLGRPIDIHEFTYESVNKEIKERCKPMILEMIKNIMNRSDINER